MKRRPLYFPSVLRFVGDNFFADFNKSGSLTSLPADSFGTVSIISAGEGFCSGFNGDGGKLKKSTQYHNPNFDYVIFLFQLNPTV